jgi:hypothetical protein
VVFCIIEVMSKSRRIRIWIGFILLALALLILTWSFWPTARMQQQITSSFGDSLSGLPGAESAGLIETRLLTIDSPRSVRVGDSDLVRMTFAVAPGSDDQNTYTIPNLYDTHNLVLEARLDVAGMQVAPGAGISEPMRRGQTITFYWSISPIQAGHYRGNLWVYLNIVPKLGGEIDRRALVAHRMDIQGLSVFGLPADIARWGGAAAGLLGLVFSIPFLEDILKRIWKSVRKNRPKLV